MGTESKKICFVHPALMDYRIELFEMINNNFDTTFLFTKQGRGQLNVKEKHLKVPENWKHKILTTKYIITHRDVGMFLKLAKEVVLNKYDVFVVSNSWYLCWILSKILRKKFIFWIEFWHWEKTSLFRSLLNNLTFYICRHSDAIIATGTKSVESQINIGVNPHKIFYHPQCSKDYSHLNAPNLKSELNILDKKVILFIGRLVESKGLEVLIKSFSLVNKKHPDAFLLVVGTGPEERYYKKLANDLNLENILFAGYVDDEIQKAAYYKACDIFVLPSIFIKGAYEPWGLVINEAMAFGKTIVTTDAVGSAFDLVENNVNGFIVKNGDVLDLSNAICKILADEDLNLTMGTNSRKIYEEKNSYFDFAQVFIDAINFVYQYS